MSVKRTILIQLCMLLALGVFAAAKDAKPKKNKKKPVATASAPTATATSPAATAAAAPVTEAKLAEPAAPTPADNSAALEKILTTMDQQAAAFHNAQADFVWDQYTKVVDDHDQQKGTIYFRRQ